MYRKQKEEPFERYLELITSQNQRLHNFTHIVSHNLKTHIGNFKTILEFLDDTLRKRKKRATKSFKDSLRSFDF
jgi:signal transduction histidine kinase